MENDNLNEKISQLLSDPEGMARIQSMAESLFGGNMNLPSAQSEAPSTQNEAEMLMKALQVLKSEKNDDRSQLLIALKPHLSTERGEKVDKAVKLLKLAKLLPLLKETDILKF